MYANSSSVIDRRRQRRCAEMRLGWSSVVVSGRGRRALRSRQLALVGDTVSYFLIVGAVWAVYTTTGQSRQTSSYEQKWHLESTVCRAGSWSRRALRLKRLRAPRTYICDIELISERDVVNSRSRSLYVIVRPSVCLSSVCKVRAPYSGD